MSGRLMYFYWRVWVVIVAAVIALNVYSYAEGNALWPLLLTLCWTVPVTAWGFVFSRRRR